MRRWDRRPLEIRNLFNPAFCGLLLLRALTGYEKHDSRGMPFSLTLLVLPLCLHKQTRDVLAENNRSYFLKIASEHPEFSVGFAQRATDLLPFAMEAFGLLMQVGTIEVCRDGRLRSTSEKVRKSDTGTPETVACQRVARFLGKEFARVGDRATIYTTLRVRP